MEERVVEAELGLPSSQMSPRPQLKRRRRDDPGKAPQAFRVARRVFNEAVLILNAADL